jgi:hypothetical protein
LAAAVGLALFGAAAIPAAVVESSHARFEDWHSAGAGLQPGMSLAEARTTLSRKSAVTELPLEAPDPQGVRFQVEPIGPAKYRFEFPLSELYYLDVRVDAAGKVAAVKPWHD